jgi:selenocysteine-specific elongation factor
MIVGTAGHIDHGKTALVRALTGVDTDRLQEEKARGISIELGYAYQPLPDGTGVLGFVDVPGHERFIHTMLAGATGVDFALLAVAADDGVMPQTVEHLEILDLLGLPAGAVAITKTDRADGGRVAAVEAEVSALLRGTCLAGAPCFPVSAVTGAGVDALRLFLYAQAGRPARPVGDEYFRLAVDRSFSLAGVGTVVTGTAFAGEIHVGDELIISPSGRPARVRGLHVQNRPATAGRRGERCAAALAGIARDEVARGEWLVAPFLHAPSDRFDLRLRLLTRNARPVVHGAPVHVHLGAWHGTGRLALLEGERLVPGSSMLAQVVLDREIHCAAGDLCVLRDASAGRTLGGGPVLDAHAPARYRRRPARIAALGAWELTEHDAVLPALLRTTEAGVDLAEFARNRNRRLESLTLPFGAHAAGGRLFSAAFWDERREKLLAALALFHEQNPDEPGLPVSRLQRMVFPRSDAALTAALVEGLSNERLLVRNGPWLHLPGHTVRLSELERALAQRGVQQLGPAVEPVWVRDLARALGCEEAEMRRTLQRMAKRGELLQIVRDLYVTPALASRYAEIVSRLVAREGGAPAARFRDESGLGRKRAIQVLEFFDRIGYTRRVGDKHRLRSGAGPAFFAGAP